MAGFWKTVYLATGSNVGNRFQHLQQALWLCEAQLGEVVDYSSVYQTAAWGNTEQDSFLNQVIKIRTCFSPMQLMRRILQIESALGRKREEKWGPRIIDMDILFYGDLIIQKPELILPHPQLHLRNFVLVPLAEIAPKKMHPILGKNINALIADCPDDLAVKIFI